MVVYPTLLRNIPGETKNVSNPYLICKILYHDIMIKVTKARTAAQFQSFSSYGILPKHHNWIKVSLTMVSRSKRDHEV